MARALPIELSCQLPYNLFGPSVESEAPVLGRNVSEWHEHLHLLQSVHVLKGTRKTGGQSNARAEVMQKQQFPGRLESLENQLLPHMSAEGKGWHRSPNLSSLPDKTLRKRRGLTQTGLEGPEQGGNGSGRQRVKQPASPHSASPKLRRCLML